MATVNRESIGNLHDKLIVTVSQEDYIPPFQKALKQYGKTANIPGFRKGNVPTGMIKKMYGQSVFADEVIRVAQKELVDYMEANKPEIIGQPLVIDDQSLSLDMNKTEDINIAYEIGLKPDFEIAALKEKGKVSRYVIKVSDELFQKEKENLRRRTGKLENPESPEESTDMVYGAYVPCDAEGNPAEGATPTEDVVTLENLPKKLAEKVKGQKAEFTLVFKPSEICDEQELEDFMKSALKTESTAEKDNTYLFRLTKTGRLIPSELNEEFFEKVFPNEGIKDETQFDNRLKEELGKESSRIGKERLENELFEKLVHETQIELPETFLKNWVKRNGEKLKTDEEVEKELPSFNHRLRWTLISNKLIDDYKLAVSQDEIKEDLKGRVLTYFNMANADDAPWMEEYLNKMMTDEKMMDETHSRLLFDKLFTKVAEVMEVKEETIDEDAFAKLPMPDYHHH